MPQFRIRNSEHKRRPTRPSPGSLDVLRMWLVDDDFDRAARVRATVYGNIDFSIHIRREIQFRNMLRRYRFEPDSLPNAAAGRVPDHATTVQSLLSDGDLYTVHIRRVVDMDNELICPIRVEILRDIH
jgi:hypothetical protein